MAVKLDDNTQFGRVSLDGTSPIGAAASNDGLAPLVDAHGRLITTPYVGGTLVNGALTMVDSGAVALFQVLKASGGRLYQAWGNQASGVVLWAMLFNIAAGPPAGAPFAAAVPVQTGGMFSFNFPEGLVFSTGITLAFSTSQVAYAAPAAGGWITGLVR